MSNIVTKISIAVVALFLVFGLVVVLKTQRDIADKQTSLENAIVQMKQIGDGVVRSQDNYVSKDDLDKLAKSLGLNINSIKSDMGSLGANLQGINTAVITTPGYHGLKLASTSTKPRGNLPFSKITDDPYGYLSNAQNLALFEPVDKINNIPIGQATFSAWLAKPWSLDIYPRNYAVTTVIGQDVEGRHYTYNKFTVTTQGKTYDLPIKDSKFQEVLPTASISLNPRLYLGLGGGLLVNPPPRAEMTPTLSVFIFSYGQTKIEPSWAALGLGIGYETQVSRPALSLTPITYNLGTHIPLIKNLHIAPTLTVDSKGSFGVLGGIHVGL